MDLARLTVLAACANRNVVSVEGHGCVVVYPIGVTPASPPVMTTKGVVGWVKTDGVETVVPLDAHTSEGEAVLAILGAKRNLGFGCAIIPARIVAGIKRVDLDVLRDAISLCREIEGFDLELFADVLHALNKNKSKKETPAEEESYW